MSLPELNSNSLRGLEKQVEDFVKATGGGSGSYTEETSYGQNANELKIFNQEGACEAEGLKATQGLGFGRIKFCQDDEPKPYVRVPWSNGEGVSTPCDLLLHFVEHVWALERPNLIVSITGAATDSLQNSNDLQQFLLDLMSFARRTSAWITTGGTHGGIMKLIGGNSPTEFRVHYRCQRVTRDSVHEHEETRIFSLFFFSKLHHCICLNRASPISIWSQNTSVGYCSVGSCQGQPSFGETLRLCERWIPHQQAGRVCSGKNNYELGRAHRGGAHRGARPQPLALHPCEPAVSQRAFASPPWIPCCSRNIIRLTYVRSMGRSCPKSGRPVASPSYHLLSLPSHYPAAPRRAASLGAGRRRLQEIRNGALPPRQVNPSAPPTHTHTKPLFVPHANTTRALPPSRTIRGTRPRPAVSRPRPSAAGRGSSSRSGRSSWSGSSAGRARSIRPAGLRTGRGERRGRGRGWRCACASKAGRGL
jgi:hypothetical protein